MLCSSLFALMLVCGLGRVKAKFFVFGLGLGLEASSPWPWPWWWSLALALNAWYDYVFGKSHKWQKNFCCIGVMVFTGDGTEYWQMVMALFTYHLSSDSNLHLILGNLFLVRLDVGSWPGHKVLGLGSQVLVNMTGCLYAILSQPRKLLELL